MAKNSVGTLSLFINGDAAGLMREFNKVDRQLGRWSKSWTKPGAKLALGFVGVESALKAVTNSVRNVVMNIENIPGVPAETAASIIGMRDNLASAKNWIDRMTAGIVAFGAQAAQAVGVASAGLAGFSDTSALSRQETPDEIASAKDAAFAEKIAAARKKLSEASRAATIASQTDVQQIIMLRQESQRYETFAKSSSINTVQRLEAQTEAQEKLNAANAKMATLRKNLAEAEKKSGEAFGAKIGAASMGNPEPRLQDLQAGEVATRRKILDLMKGDQEDPAVVKAQIDAQEQLAQIYQRQVPLLEKQNELSKEVGATIGSSFEDAIFQGGKFSDVLKQLALDFTRLMFQQGVTKNLADGAGSMFSSFRKVLGFADGGRPPVGQVSVVGERGPELFVPDTAGRIIPNHAIGGQGGGDTYVFSPQIQSGVTRQEVASMLPPMFDRFVAMVADKNQRGGTFRKAMA